MIDVSTSADFNGPKVRRFRLIDTLIGVILCMTFILVAMGLALLFSRNKSFTTTPRMTVRAAHLSFDAENVERTMTLYPFLGVLYSKKPEVLLCTCTIVTKKHLLTAANCLTTNFPNLAVSVLL